MTELLVEPRTWTVRARTALWGLSALLSLSFLTQIQAFDFWWHLATGRWIVEHGQLPSVDPFSFTLLGQTWTNVAWPPDLLMYGVYCALGFAGIVALKAAVAFAFLALLASTLRRFSISATVAGLVLVLVTVLVQDRFSQERPEAQTVPFVVVGLLIVASYFERGPREPLSLATLRLGPLWFVPLCGTWMFAHGSALLCLPLVGLCAVWSTVPAHWVGPIASERTPRRSASHWSAWLASVLVALLFVATPRGREILEHARGANATLIAQLTREWAPLDWHEAPAYALLGYHLISLGGALAAARRARRGAGNRTGWAALGLTVLGMAIGLRVRRHICLGVLFSAPGIALSLEAVRSALHAARSELGWKALVAAFPIAMPGVLIAFVGWPVDFRFGLGVDEDRFHADAVEVLRRLPPGHVFNGLGDGGHLIWERVPGGVFIDGRTLQLYDEAFVKDVLYPMLTHPPVLEEMADRYDIQYGLVGGDSIDAKALMESPRWLPIFYGRGSTLFIRERYLSAVEPALRALGIQPYRELRFIQDQAWMDAYYRPLLADPLRKQALGYELVRAYRTHAGRAVRGAANYLKTADREFTRAVLAALQPPAPARNPNLLVP